MMQSKRIGITGGIATGKSTVTRYLKEKGFTVIDADQITHELYDHSVSFQEKIVSSFGKEIAVDGKIDRKALGAMVFKDNTRKKALEEIAHPLIFEKIAEETAAAEKNEKTVFIDIPLLFEVREEYRRKLRLDKIWLVYTTEDLQLKRLMERNNLSKEEAVLRINSQLPLNKKIELSDVILYNIKNVNFLYEQIDNELRDEGIL